MSGGFVSLIGAGPGDPGLLTLRGRRAIERADVVLYDYLSSQALLESVSVAAQERIHVGKRSGSGLSKQEAINALLVKRALAGQRVARLKGGDPFVFGRGAEEAQACVEAGVPFEIIPGISSVVAAPAYAGIPVTHRDHASGFTVVTGHERWDTAEQRVDWTRIAGRGGTIVVLMGIHQIRRWTGGLLESGLAPETPVALVRWGTLPEQWTLVSTLAEVADEVAAKGFKPPAVAVVGEVVGCRETLRWFDNRPLFSRVVGHARYSPRDAETFERLAGLGATVLHVPLVQQEPVDDGAPLDAALTAGGFTDLVFTSANGVHYFRQSLDRTGLDARALAGVATWAVGPATARAMRSELCLGADHVPEAATGAALVAHAEGAGVDGRRFLFPAAAGARETVPAGLRALGAEVAQIPCYETVANPSGPARLESALAHRLELLAIASPSAVRALKDALETLKLDAEAVPLACIGPTTAGAARRLGLSVALVAETHTMEGLASAMEAHLLGA